MQETWGPPAIAKKVGHVWKALGTSERKIISEVARFLHRQHEQIMAEFRARLWAAGEDRMRMKRNIEKQRWDHKAKRAKLRGRIRALVAENEELKRKRVRR